MQLWIEGVEPGLSVRRALIRAQLSDLFSVTILARSPRPDLDLEAMLFRHACLSIHHHNVRQYSGLCASAEQIQAEPTGLSTYALRIVPRLWLATLRHNYRIFQHLSVPEIVTAILGELSVPHTLRIDEDAFPELEYRVQYGESDYAFLCRLCEDAGLSFFFEDDEGIGEGGASVAIFSDAPGIAAPRHEAPLPYVDQPSEAARKGFLTRVRLTHEGRVGAVALRDVDFRHPALSLATQASHLDGTLSRYRYVPGAFRVVTELSSTTPVADRDGAARHDPMIGQELAERALRAEHAGAHVISFETNALDLSPGAVVSMAGHPHPALDDRRRLLVTHLALDAEHDKAFRAQGKAVFADQPYAPPRVTPRPLVHGLETAVVTGPPDREVFTDENGRVRVRFPWDRARNGDAQSSCWIRVSQGWAGAGYGLWTIPRVGQEVLIGFLGGNPDEPIIIGRAPNALNPAPYPLPSHETKSVWRSRSTPNGEGYNEISFEDLRGQERIYERAERDKESLIRGDERRVVGHDRSRLVNADENISIGGRRREEIGGSLHQTIHAEHRTQIGGDVSLLVGGNRQEQLGGRWAVKADGAIHLVSSHAIVIEAPDITLKGAGGFVRVGEGGVTTHGGWAEIHPGAPGVGEGRDPAVPERPALAAASFPGLPVPAPNVRRLPVLGFPGLSVPLSPAVDLEKGVICDAMCSCKDSTTALGNRNPDGCTRTRLWAYDRALGNKSTIKAQVPFDMSQIPPVPIMSRNDPSRPKTKPDKGTRAPDVVLVKDPNRPPTQDNIKKIIEIKFPGDRRDPDQMKHYEKIAGGAPVELWTLEDCGCDDKKKQRDPIRVPIPTGERAKEKEKEKVPMPGPGPSPVPVPVPAPAPTPTPSPAPSRTADKVEGVLIALLILALILDDLVGGEADDAAIPPLIARMLQKLAPAF